jgi:hypothetical protein
MQSVVTIASINYQSEALINIKIFKEIGMDTQSNLPCLYDPYCSALESIRRSSLVTSHIWRWV